MRDDYDFGYFADEAIYEAQKEMEWEDEQYEMMMMMNRQSDDENEQNPQDFC